MDFHKLKQFITWCCLSLLLSAQSGLSGMPLAVGAEPMERPLVIAHRGASGYLPEHTAAAKALAFGQGADYLEQDVVLTRDGIPIVAHDIHLDRITDVATRFPDRVRSDGRYYAIDFDWSEIQLLRVTERLDKNNKPVFPGRFPAWTGEFRLSSLAEELELIRGLNHSTGRQVGIYPELKQPAFHRAEGKDLSRIVLKVLAEYGYASADSPCYLQCFEEDEVRRVHGELKCQLPLILLISADKNWQGLLQQPAALEQRLQDVATFCSGVGPHLELVFDEALRTGRGNSSRFVQAAHQVGLQVHGWTFRADQLECGAKSFAELHRWGQIAGLQGFFTDFPDQTLQLLQGR